MPDPYDASADLRAMKNLRDTTTSDVLRDILTELIYTEPRVKTFYSVPAGAHAARIVKGNGDLEHYEISYTASEKNDTLRVANLVHELTHVRVNEAYFDNDFIDYANAGNRGKELPDMEVGGSKNNRPQNEADRQTARRNTDAEGHLALTRNRLEGFLPFAGLTTEQRAKVQEKLDYCKPILHLEYDTCINQILTYCMSWGVSAETDFFKLLEAAALDAYNRRALCADVTAEVTARARMTTTERRTRYATNYTKIAEPIIDNLGDTRDERVTIDGVAVDITSERNDGHKNDKKEALKTAIEWLRRGGSGYTELGTTLPIKAIIKPGGASIGLVVKENVGDPYVLMILTDTMFTYRPKVNIVGAEDVTQGGTRGGLHNIKERLVADQIYDYYKPTWTVNAQKRRTLTAVLHEFGHVLHQWRTPDDYFQLVDEHNAIYNTRSASKAVTDKHKEIRKIAKYVSQYCSSEGQEFGAPEFVAEMFSGLMLGLPYEHQVVQAYLGCGGPLPPVGTAHVRTRRTLPGCAPAACCQGASMAAHRLTDATITSEQALRDLLGEPTPIVCAKVAQKLNRLTRQFIERSPFVCVATSDLEGRCDVSPRGDPAGFVRILDDSTLLIPERPGNRLADTLRNIIANPHVGLLFVIPGVGDSFRVNGRATITTDQALLAPCVVEEKVPRLGVIVDIDEAYTQCSKAFLRSQLWEPSRFVDRASLPTNGEIHRELAGGAFDADGYDAERAARYARREGFY